MFNGTIKTFKSLFLKKIDARVFADGNFPEESSVDELSKEFSTIATGLDQRVVLHQCLANTIQREKYFYYSHCCRSCNKSITLACHVQDVVAKKRKKTHQIKIKVNYFCAHCGTDNQALIDYEKVFRPLGKEFYDLDCHGGCKMRYSVENENLGEARPKQLWHQCPKCNGNYYATTNHFSRWLALQETYRSDIVDKTYDSEQELNRARNLVH